MDSLFLIIGYLLGISSGVILNKGILSKRYAGGLKQS